MTEGKQEFYKKAEESLRNAGYTVYGEKDIPGIGVSHLSKPDYIAVKGNSIIIGEIKSPKESPSSSSWRQVQKGDSEEFKRILMDVTWRENYGGLTRNVGGHEIIIRGQIPDYISKLGQTYLLPSAIAGGAMELGYSFPTEETFNVNMALNNMEKKPLRTISEAAVTTYIIAK